MLAEARTGVGCLHVIHSLIGHIMNKCIFLAGATGAIGRRLAPMLIADGWRVIGTTRSAAKQPILRDMGVEPVIVDVFNSVALSDAVAQAKPQIVIHQLTDLPPGLEPAAMGDALVRNARIRDEGTRNLVSAAVRAGARRLIAQSIVFVYEPGPMPYRESDPLCVDAEGDWGLTARGVASLERQVLEAPLEGIVLRYGALYGPGTGFDVATGPAPLHVDAAAKAAHLAVSKGDHGVYNVAETDGTVSSERIEKELDWRGDWRISR
jgi:nucleoside-diphosphate-sugar epimerase